MEHQRGRSPSQGHQQSHINHGGSQSPQNYPGNLSPSLANTIEQGNNITSNQQYSNGGYNTDLSAYDNSFLSAQPGQQFVNSGGLLDPSFAQNQDFPQFKEENGLYGQQSYSEQLLNTNNFGQADFSLYSTPGTQTESFDGPYYTDGQQPSGNINPQDLISDMSSPQAKNVTPPNLLQADPQGQQISSAHHSPSFNQLQFPRSPGHSRQTSLNPESAAFPNAQLPADWSMMPPQFTTHRRSASEYSDVSVSSAGASPNLAQHDTFESIEQHHSPLVRPQDPGLYQEVLGIGNFSLSDPQIQQGTRSPRRGISPAHTPSLSPRLGPQQVPVIGQGNFMLQMDNQFQQQAGENYVNQAQDFGVQSHHDQTDMGQAQQMVPPEINVEFAPASRQNSFEPPKPGDFDQDALTPPERGRRRRALSDPYNAAGGLVRPMTPASLGAVGTPDSRLAEPSRSLSPFDRSSTSSPIGKRRQSTSALPNRDYILGLADPEYQASSGGVENGNAKRLQKHPATFQCTLCTKRFTRAYNLRSHLRTHTDERPFVCTVCGKAFARQHDRKRHEGLHSGEKKFVCKGDLKQGGQWGCGRRFARADALGRHFRSEAGRICIKPLLDEEAFDRQRQWQEQHMQNMAQNMQHQAPPPPMTMDGNGFPMDASGNYTLPAALLAQYPALATLSWADLPQGDVMDDEISGRSSFDASGSEYFDEADEGGYVSGPGTAYGHGQMNETYVNEGYSSDYGGR